MPPSDSLLARAARPADLRAALLDAATRADRDTLVALCQQHQDEIRDAFPTWQNVPDDVRRDPEAQTRYAEALIAIAQLFEQVGDGSLIATLMGKAGDDPLSAWERALATARSLLEQGQSREAADLLQSTLARTDGLQGGAAPHQRARTHGMRGVALFRAGDHAAGIEATRRARALCEQAGDPDGVATYEGNLQRMLAAASSP